MGTVTSSGSTTPYDRQSSRCCDIFDNFFDAWFKKKDFDAWFGKYTNVHAILYVFDAYIILTATTGTNFFDALMLKTRF